MMMAKRIGKWAWALSAQERVTAAVVDAARGDVEGTSARTRRAYDAMMVKQKKLLARQNQNGGLEPRRRTGPGV